MSNTQQVKDSMVRRLESVFGTEGLPYLTDRDYPTVLSKLGWAESTYRTALRHLGNDPGQLMEGVRTYVPTDHDYRILSEHVSAPFLTVLTLTGCRLSEAWRMRIIMGNSLVVYTQKGSANQIINLNGIDDSIRARIMEWVYVESHERNMEAIRKQWRRVVKKHGLDPQCVPHAFRHRAITLLAEQMSLDDVQMFIGHRNRTTTSKYIHKNLGKRVAEILVPST